MPQALEYFRRYGASFLLEAWKAERSFSVIYRIYHRLRNSILTDLLRSFVVIGRHGHLILILKTNIWTPTLIRWWHFSLFIDALFIRYLYYLLVINFMILISAKSIEVLELQIVFSLYCGNCQIVWSLTCWWLSSTIWIFKYRLTCCDLKYS